MVFKSNSAPPEQNEASIRNMIQIPQLLIRTDASTQIGMGHLSRCLTLGRALQQEGAAVRLVMTDPSTQIKELVSGKGFSLETLPPGISEKKDALSTLDLVRQYEALGVVLDGYHFGQAYLDRLAEKICLLFFDELNELDLKAAVILNQNLYAKEEDYASTRWRCRLLLGSQYAVLRPDFHEQRQEDRDHPQVGKNILLNFGGSDPHNLTSLTLHGLQKSNHRYHIKSVLGPGHAKIEDVQRLAAESKHTVEVLNNIPNMSEVMNWAHLAMSASGTNTTLEMCCMGLPAVIVIQADNQRLIGLEMQARGMGVLLGDWQEANAQQICQELDRLASNQAERQKISNRGMAAVDGLGALKVAREFLKICTQEKQP